MSRRGLQLDHRKQGIHAAIIKQKDRTAEHVWQCCESDAVLRVPADKYNRCQEILVNVGTCADRITTATGN